MLSRASPVLLRRSVHMSNQQLNSRRLASKAAANNAAGSSSYTPLDIHAYMSVLNSRRQPSAIRSLMPLLQLPGMISLGGGLPNPALFPFKQLSFALADGTSLTLTD